MMPHREETHDARNADGHGPERLIEEYLGRCRRASRPTDALTRQRLGELAAYLETRGRTLSEAAEADAAAWLRELCDGGAGDSDVHAAAAAADNFYRFLERSGVGGRSHGAGAYPRLSAWRVTSLLAAHRRAVRVCALPQPTTLKGMRARAILALHFMAGLTAGEIAALKLEHADIPCAYVVVQDEDGGSRRVCLNRSAVDALDAYVGVRAEYAVSGMRSLLVNFDGRQLAATAVASVLNRAARLADPPHAATRPRHAGRLAAAAADELAAAA